MSLYKTIHAKRKRIKPGAKERMARPNEAGYPKASAYQAAAKTAKKKPKGRA